MKHVDAGGSPAGVPSAHHHVVRNPRKGLICGA